LTQAHAFVDGNKRVAAAVMEAFLITNGFELLMKDDELVDLFLRIAASELNRDEIEQLLRQKTTTSD
jgi:death on curing protein